MKNEITEYETIGNEPTSIIILSNDPISIDKVSKFCDLKKGLILAANTDSKFIDFSIFIPMVYSLGIGLNEMEQEILSKYKTIIVFNITSIDNESMQFLIRLKARGLKIIGISRSTSFLENFNKFIVFIDDKTQFVLLKENVDNYTRIMVQNISERIIFEDIEFINPSSKESEDIGEIGRFIYLLPKDFLFEHGKGIYRRIMELKKAGIVKEGSYSYYMENEANNAQAPFSRSPEEREVLKEFAKDMEKRLDNPSLNAFLYYYGGDWDKAAESLRTIIKKMFNRKQYDSVIKVSEMLFRISEMNDDDNFYMGVSLYYIGRQRRALKILDSLGDKGYFSDKWDRIKDYLEIIFDYHGFTQANKFLSSIESVTPKEIMADLYRSFARIALDKGDIDQAEIVFSRLKDILDVSNFDCELFRLFGNLYLQKNKTSMALRYYEKGYEFALLRDDKVCMAKSLNNLGILYYQSLNLDKSYEYYEKSRSISRLIGDELSYATTTGNMIPIAIDMGDIIKADALLKELENIRNIEKSRTGLANAYFSLADHYMGQWKLDEAISLLNKGLYLIIEKGNFIDISDFLFKMAMLEELSGLDNNYTIELARRFGDKYSESYSFWLGEIELLKGNFENSYLQIKKAFKRVEKSGNLAITQEDELRLRFLEYVLFKRIPSPVPMDKLYGEDRKMYSAIINYLSASLSEEQVMKFLETLPPFYRDLGIIMIKGVQGIKEDLGKEILGRINQSIIEFLS